MKGQTRDWKLREKLRGMRRIRDNACKVADDLGHEFGYPETEGEVVYVTQWDIDRLKAVLRGEDDPGIEPGRAMIGGNP